MSEKQQKKILFTPRSKEYAFLSNFYPSDLTIDGKVYWHVEGYYQSQKYQGVSSTASEHIRRVCSPNAAKKISRGYVLSEERKKEWNDGLKVEVMKKAVLIKFLTNRELFDKLLATGDAILVEHIASDDYWGDGKNGDGHNVLGKILTGVRSILAGITISEH